ncbi:MAG: hypothetical protein Q7J85_12550 [Bacillota bacterium]|nr:hypothetical protein [Bacillota bacterium]
MDEQWLSEHTISKANHFYWKIDQEGNVSIKRKFKNMKVSLVHEIPAADLEKLHEYLSDGAWRALANNVVKLRLKKEEDGLGRFLYENLRMNETGSQLASHLGAIFSNSGAWLYNGKKRSMKFKRNTEDWLKVVKDYYEKSIT